MNSADLPSAAASSLAGAQVVVLMPVYNDWISADELLRRLDAAFVARPESVSVLIVNDGSLEAVPETFGTSTRLKIGPVEFVRLKKNLGHQRALAVGLCHLAAKVQPEAVVVMDSDGEDDPADAVRLVAHLSSLPATASRPIVFAERTRRSESFRFRLGYLGYRMLHAVLTGRSIRFGNFSAIAGSSLAAITIEPMLWNHYAASVAARLPFTTIPTRRARRIAGHSRFNSVGLVAHGLSALSCYNEIIGVRLLLFSSVFFVLSLLGVLGLIGLRLFTTVPLPGWTSIFAGILLILLLQIVTLASNFTLQMIGARSIQPFLPIRDYHWHIAEIFPLKKSL